MLVKTRGVVFKSLKYGDNSLITDIFTEELGLRSYIVNGVSSKSGNNKMVFFQPATLLDLIVYEREEKSLGRIKEFAHHHIFQRIPFDILYGSISLFMIEVTRNSIREKTVNRPLFQFVFDNIYKLDEENIPLSLYPQTYLVRLSEHLGFAPNGHWTENLCYFNLREGNYESDFPVHPDYLDPAESYLLHLLNTLDDSELIYLDPQSKISRKIILEKLLHYYHLHIEQFREIRSVEILSQIMHV